MCKKCRKKNLSLQQTNCNYTLDNIVHLLNRVECLNSYISLEDYNRYKGILISLINLNNFCQYDLTEIINKINENNC